MKKLESIAILGLLLSCLLFFQSITADNKKSRKLSSQSTQSIEESSATRVILPSGVVPKISSDQESLKKGTVDLLELVRDVSTQTIDLKTLEREIQKFGDLVSRSSDENPYTGGMIIYDVNEPIDGIDFLQIQLFQSDSGFSLQNLTIVLNSKSLNQETLKQVIADHLQLEVTSIQSNSALNLWKLSSGYNLWTQTLIADDINESRQLANAGISPGTLRIVFEADMH